MFWNTCVFNFYWKYIAVKNIKNSFSHFQKDTISFNNIFFWFFFPGFLGFTFFLKFKILNNKSLWSSSNLSLVIVQLYIFLPKVLITPKVLIAWKLYVFLSVLKYEFSLSIAISIYLLLLRLFLASSLHVFSGMPSLIANYRVIEFKFSKASTCFFLFFNFFRLFHYSIQIVLFFHL